MKGIFGQRNRLKGSFFRDKPFATFELDFGCLGLPLNQEFITGDIPRHTSRGYQERCREQCVLASLINLF